MSDAPHIEGFVDNQHPDRVAGIEHCHGWRVVSHSDGIESGLLKQPDFADFCLVYGFGSQWTVVGMDAAATHFHGPAVEQKSLVGIEIERTDAEALGAAVGFPAVNADGCLQSVENRGVGRPQPGIRNRD